jgi:hypothetical protein|tara:strand:- start:260 stop:832 length:573 start_codon:yes stop_codon:yes gene_type:complete
MNTSESVKEIATALSAAQSSLQDATKNSKAYNYKYADLSQVLEEIRPALKQHNLSVVQLPFSSGSRVGVVTRLLHSSGEWIEESIDLEVEGQNLAQATGSHITYLRRYSLASLFAITQKDDDAESAPKREARPSQPKGKAPSQLEKQAIDAGIVTAEKLAEYKDARSEKAVNDWLTEQIAKQQRAELVTV